MANLHASAGPSRGAAADELVRAAERALDWAAGDPLVFGGDFNLRPRARPGGVRALRERFGLGEPTGPRRSTTCSRAGSRVEERPRRLGRPSAS